MRVRSEGMPELLVPIQVVPATVALTAEALVLRDLPVGTRGTITLHAPRGESFQRLDVPVELRDVVRVTGVGTATVVVSLEPSPALAETVSLPLALAPVEAAVAGARFVDVEESLEEDAARPHRNSYRIPCPGEQGQDTEDAR